MTLFTKPNCKKCDYIKETVDLPALGVNVEVLTPENAGSLAHLAWHELVAVAEETLPILVLDDCTSITGAINIKNYLLTKATLSIIYINNQRPNAERPLVENIFDGGFDSCKNCNSMHGHICKENGLRVFHKLITKCNKHDYIK